MNEIYVVGVSHNTEQGEIVADIVLLTEDIREAVRIARAIGNFGYEFSSIDTGVAIRRVEINRPYFKTNRERPEKNHSPRAHVFIRSHAANHGASKCAESHWEETWLNGKLQRLVDGDKRLN